MNIRKEQSGVLRQEVTAEDLALINTLAKSALRAEEVYTFAVRLCDNEVDRDFERFDENALRELQKLFLGRSGIFDHAWSAAGQTARIYKTEVVEEPGIRTEAGDGYCYLKGYAYMLKNEKNATLIQEIEGGIKKEVSVGCSVRKSVCSVCGRDWQDGTCSHRKGESYGGKRCFVELREPTDAYEWSFVAVPAQRQAGVMRKRFGGEKPCENLRKFVEQSGITRFDQELGELEKLACLGQSYLEELRREVLRLALLTEKNVDSEVFGGIAAKLSEAELKELRRTYETRLAALYPVAPQLWHAEEAESGRDEGVFLV